MKKYNSGRKFAIVSLILALVLTACGASDEASETTGESDGSTPESSEPTAAEPMELQMGSSSATSSIYAMNVAWSDLINRLTQHDAAPVTTGGGVENMRLVASGETAIGSMTFPVVANAMAGGGDFAGQESLYQDLRFLWAYTFGEWEIITLASSGIESFADIKPNTRISVGGPGSAGERIVPILLEAHGLKEGVDYQAERLDTAQGAQALIDGQIDITVIGGATPTVPGTEIASRRDVRTLEIDPEIGATFAAANPGWFVGRINIGYPTQLNEPPTWVIQWKQGAGVHKDLPEQVAYDITKALFDNLDTFHQVHADAKLITLETALKDVEGTLYLHPGALRYYLEQGVDVPSGLIAP